MAERAPVPARSADAAVEAPPTDPGAPDQSEPPEPVEPVHPGEPVPADGTTEWPEAHPEPGPIWGWVRSHGPLVVLGLVILFNLWALHPNAYVTTYANDSSVHVSMARWANMRIEEGHLPFDGWFPYLDLGAPRFHHYQSLPAIVTGAIGTVVGTDGAFHWLTYLLIALWPICVFFTMRLLEWEPWPAVMAAVVSPIIVSAPLLGYEWGSYTWGGYGLYTQLWGMWLMPLSWALTWRAVSGRGKYWHAALVSGLCIGAHLLTGYLALLVIGVWVLIKPSEILRRAGRALIVGVGTLAAAAWVLVPLLTDAKWTTQDPFSHGNAAYDSFGALKILRWLFTGALFDNQRFPVISILAAIGFVVCLARFRRDERARVILGAGTLAMLLFFGRSTMGPALDLLPGNGDLFLRRYVFGVHMAGIMLAGIGAVYAGRGILRVARRIRIPRNPRWRPAFAVGAVVVLGTGWFAAGYADRGHYASRQFTWVKQQRQAEAATGADFRALVAKAKTLGPGRFFSGQGSSWGKDYMVGFAPNDIELLFSLVDAVGFNRPTWSLSSSVTHYINSRDPDQARLFNIRYLIQPADSEPLVPARKIMERGKFALFEVPGPGYFELVDATAPPITADRTNLGVNMQEFLKSDLIGRRLYPTVEFGGDPAAPPTVTSDEEGTGLGSVRSQVAEPEQGRFVAEVDVRRRAMLMLKASYDPRWRVTVDGEVVKPQMIAPSFVGREVGPGRHTVEFQYVPYGWYWLMFLISIGSIVVLALVDRRRRDAIALAASVPPFTDRPPRRRSRHAAGRAQVADGRGGRAARRRS